MLKMNLLNSLSSCVSFSKDVDNTWIVNELQCSLIRGGKTLFQTKNKVVPSGLSHSLQLLSPVTGSPCTWCPSSKPWANLPEPRRLHTQFWGLMFPITLLPKQTFRPMGSGKAKAACCPNKPGPGQAAQSQRFSLHKGLQGLDAYSPSV